MGEGHQKAQTSSCKINESWDIVYSMATIVNNERVDLKTFCHKKKIL